jgi:hypothetical protein
LSWSSAIRLRETWPNYSRVASNGTQCRALGHFLHLEAPDKLNMVIAGYLKGAVKQE